MTGRSAAQLGGIRVPVAIMLLLVCIGALGVVMLRGANGAARAVPAVA